MKKYSTQYDETKKLFRIQALRDIPSLGVKAGDLGGWIESESNLSQSDDCWVFGEAMVSGKARVSGNAWVYGEARVSDEARVFGNASVSGRRWIVGKAEIGGEI